MLSERLLMPMILLHDFGDLYLNLISAFGHLLSLGGVQSVDQGEEHQLTIMALQPVDDLISSGVVLDCMSD